jgi:SagB-type dehydrogenase family enzyme
VPATLSFIDGVRLNRSGSTVRVVGPGTDLLLRRPAVGSIDMLRLIAAGNESHRTLMTRALARAGLQGVRRFYELLAQLIARGWVIERVVHGRTPLVSALPLTTNYQWTDPSVGERDGRLSSFAFIRRDGTRLALESPTAHARIVLHDRRCLLLLSRLFDPGPPSAGRALETMLPRTAVRAITSVLWSAGFLTPVDEEVEPRSLLFWEFHDLLFHSRTRLGRYRAPYGATYRLEGRVPAPPVFKPRPAGERIPLFKPDLARLSRTDWTLTRALETRRSKRRHGKASITRRELGEFLFRTAAVRSVRTNRRYPTSVRVYPSGGAAHALELYLVVRGCRGLEPGLHYYDPDNHGLYRVAPMTMPVRSLLAGAARAARVRQPQLLVVIAARFQRVSWKYSSISYSLVLKEVGALMQTMYLVATAMGLGACAIGGGDADVFTKAAGTDYYTESSVGEFILGRLPRSKS